MRFSECVGVRRGHFDLNAFLSQTHYLHFKCFENRRKNVLKVEVLLLVFLNEVCRYMLHRPLYENKKIDQLLQLR